MTQHRYPMASGHRRGGLYVVDFETNGSSDPDGIVDTGDIVSTIAHAATGRYTITLNDTFTSVDAIANLVETDTNAAQVSGGSTSTVQVSTLNSSLAEADTTDKTVRVFIFVHDD